MSKETKLCKHCQTEIPKKAKICPNCKKKQGGIAKWIVLVVIGVIVMAAIVGGNGDGEENEPKKVGEVQETPDNSGKQEEEKKTLFKKGEVAELNDVQVTLTDFKESTGSDFNEPSEGNIFLLTEFEILNNTEEDLGISSALSFEAYADDYAVNYSLNAIIDIEGTQLDGAIAAGKKMKGWIGYEVPEDYKNVEIHFTDNVWSDNKFVFLIEND